MPFSWAASWKPCCRPGWARRSAGWSARPGSATSATASRSPPVRCWSPRRPRDPLLVALAGLLQRLPWLLFGLYAGVLADRVDRRAWSSSVDLLRAAVLVVLTVAAGHRHVDIAVVLVAMFLLGTAEVFADTTSGTLLPMVVAKADLGIGNARLMAGFLTTNQLVGPADRRRAVRGRHGLAVRRRRPCAWRSARVLISRMAVPPPCAAGRAHATSGRDIAEGFRWTWGNGAVRTLTLTIVTFNVTFGAAWSVLVLYAIERLDLGRGRLRPAHDGRRARRRRSARRRTTGSSGTSASATIMRVGLIIETFTHLALALTTDPLGGDGGHVRRSARTPSSGGRRRGPSGCARCRPSCRAASAAST